MAIKDDFLFLDIGMTRLIWGYVRQDERLAISVCNIRRLGGQLDGQVLDAAISSLIKMRKDFGCASIKKVFVIGGIGDLIEGKSVSKGNVFPKKKAISGKDINSLKFAVWNQVRKSGVLPLDLRLDTVKVDGVLYSDETAIGKSGESITVSGYVFYISNDMVYHIKEFISNMGLKLLGIGVRELFLIREFLGKNQKRVLVMDIGFSRTIMLWMVDGRLCCIRILDIGSKDITVSIVEELGVPFWLADKLRDVFFDPFLRKDKWIRVSDGVRLHKFPRDRLAMVVEGVLDKIVSRIQREILMTTFPLDDFLVVVTGGMSIVEGFLEFLGQRIGLPTRLAFCAKQTTIDALQPIVAPYRFVASRVVEGICEGEMMGVPMSWRCRLVVWFDKLLELF